MLRVLCLLLFVLGLGACASRSPFDDWRGAGDGAPTGTPASATGLSDHATATDRPESAAAAWYVQRALVSNPQIAAARERVERVRERIPQTRALADPMAMLTVGDLAETASGQVEFIVAVQQALPAPGTLDAREAVAKQEVEVALGELHAVTRQIEADLHRTYWSLYGASREAAILGQNRTLLEQIRDAVQTRVRVGDARQDDLLRVSRRLAAMENRIDRATQREASARAMLRRLIADVGPLPDLADDVQAPAMRLDRDVLVQQARQRNPEVRVAQARASTFRERIGLARIDRRPDFVVGVQYGAVRDGGRSPVADGKDQIGATVGMTLPLWSAKYDAAEREAMRGVNEAVAAVGAAQDRATFLVDDAVSRIDLQRAVVARLRDRMMPDARQTITVALKGYQTGEVEFLQLLDDFEALLDDQVDESRAIAAWHQAVADLEYALGSTLADDVDGGPGANRAQGDVEAAP